MRRPYPISTDRLRSSPARSTTGLRAGLHTGLRVSLVALEEEIQLPPYRGFGLGAGSPCHRIYCGCQLRRGRGDVAELRRAEIAFRLRSRRIGDLARLGAFAGEPAVARFRIPLVHLYRMTFNAI